MNTPEAQSMCCPVCSSTVHEPVLRLDGLPVLINAQVRREAARTVPTGVMDLVVCTGCAHLFNRSFDPGLLDYDASYENTLHFSEAFRTHARQLARRLVEVHGLAGGSVGELGSGPGHFLSMLCEAGVARAVGFDPSYDAGRFGAPDHPGVEVCADPFPLGGSLSVDLALSQHVLEHLEDPVAALVAMRDAVVASAGMVYSEVPNGELMIRECALWDLIYEHRSYFVPHSLGVACSRAGLAVSEMGVSFGDQFLWCEARPGPTASAVASDDNVESLVAAARRFGVHALERIEQARRELALASASGPVVLWGAGSKGATYLNLVADAGTVAAVVDINPRKNGWGVPGTAFEICLPDCLRSIRPATVLVANPVYGDEIRQMLASMGVSSTVSALWGSAA